MGNMSASDLDVADRTKFDKVKQKCCVGILLTCVLELCIPCPSQLLKRSI